MEKIDGIVSIFWECVTGMRIGEDLNFEMPVKWGKDFLIALNTIE